MTRRRGGAPSPPGKNDLIIFRATTAPCGCLRKGRSYRSVMYAGDGEVPLSRALRFTPRYMTDNFYHSPFTFHHSPNLGHFTHFLAYNGANLKLM